jgi:hypothetical protein
VAKKDWTALGWKDPFWEVVRYYFSLRGKKEQRAFRSSLALPFLDGRTDWRKELGLTQVIMDKLENYLADREKAFDTALSSLRTEKEAQSFCEKNDFTWEVTATKSKDHHQSSKVLIAAVAGIAAKVCLARKTTLESNPQRRCVWAINNQLHVTARNLDGVIPSLKNPTVVWEIKEYWGKSKGGSKMSDAVYECHLVGREIREFELRSKAKINHYVFLDGREQWLARKSDLSRFIDLENQGFIDRLFVGSDVETGWELELIAAIR